MASNSAGVQTLVGSVSMVAEILGSFGVVVEAAAHLQQFGDGDVVAVGHARDVLRHRIVETELAFLGELQDHRGRHRLGVRGDPEVGVGAGRACAPSSVVP